MTYQFHPIYKILNMFNIIKLTNIKKIGTP